MKLSEQEKLEKAVADLFAELNQNDPSYMYELQRVHAYRDIMSSDLDHTPHLNEGEFPSHLLIKSAIEASTSSRCLAVFLERQKTLGAKVDKLIQLISTGTIALIIYFVLISFA